MSDAPHEVLQIDVSSPDGDGAVAMTLAGELDLVSTKDFTASVAGVRRSAPSRVTIDLAGLSFVDSSGINALVQAVRALEEEGATASLVSPSAATRRIFAIARVMDIVNVIDAPPDAPLLDHAPLEDRPR